MVPEEVSTPAEAVPTSKLRGVCALTEALSQATNAASSQRVPEAAGELILRFGGKIKMVQDLLEVWSNEPQKASRVQFSKGEMQLRVEELYRAMVPISREETLPLWNTEVLSVWREFVALARTELTRSGEPFAFYQSRFEEHEQLIAGIIASRAAELPDSSAAEVNSLTLPGRIAGGNFTITVTDVPGTSG